jgi:hypothetical protein
MATFHNYLQAEEAVPNTSFIWVVRVTQVQAGGEAAGTFSSL